MARPLSVLEADWLEHLAADGVAPSTVKSYRSRLRAVAAFTDVDGELVNALHWKALFRAPWDASTRRLRMSTLRSFHLWLKDEGQPFCEAVVNGALPRPKRSAPNPFGTDEIAELRRVAKRLEQPDWQAYFFILDATGCRAHDPLSLDLRDCENFWGNRKRDQRLWLHFRETKRGRYHCPVWQIAEPHSGTRGRPSAVLLPRVLKRYRTRADLERGPLFVGRAGTRRTHRWVETRWRAHCELAGVTGTLGQLRHTFACEELERTTDVMLVRDWMNHASIDTTTMYADYVAIQTRRNA